jgi:hypothetical protein
MQNLATVFDFLFGCHHSNLTASLRSGARLIACVATAEPRSSIHSRRCRSSAVLPHWTEKEIAVASNGNLRVREMLAASRIARPAGVI